MSERSENEIVSVTEENGRTVGHLTLEDIHYGLTDNRISNVVVDEAHEGIETIHITNLDAETTPAQVEEFTRAYEDCIQAIRKLDVLFHDLWGCR